jgi:hypothetical protein
MKVFALTLGCLIMKRIDNLGLLKHSLDNREPYIDASYIKQGNLIISKDPGRPTALMKANLDLIKAISAYEFSVVHGDQMTAKKAIDKIHEYVQCKHMNFSEFASFWPVVDISYSVYKNMEDSEQKKILQRILQKYTEMRHGLYLNYGYSPTTLQVGKDAKAHKESGSPGLNKVSDILDSFGFKRADHESIINFTSKGTKKYIAADKKGKRLFKELLKHYKIQFNWSRNRQGKMPDVLMRHKNDIIIIEHKHIKEGGGGQANAINEIISFIGYSEDGISYVSFMDGTYFNLLADNISSKNKLYTQLNNIKALLKGNKNNYFVNTAGFKMLLKYLN